MYYVSMHSFRSGKFSISLIQALTSYASTKAFSFEIDTRLKLLRFCVVLLILEIRQMEFYATVHEQCLTQKKKKILAWGSDWRIAETKSASTAVASSWGNNYLG